MTRSAGTSIFMTERSVSMEILHVYPLQTFADDDGYLLRSYLFDDASLIIGMIARADVRGWRDKFRNLGK